jgi:hypothetical protein
MIAVALLLLLVVAVGFVCARSDGVPLDEEQAIALNSIYVALNCSRVALACPSLDPQTPICPNISKAMYSERLTCKNGKVLAIGIYNDELGGGGSLSQIGQGLRTLTELHTLYIFGHDDKLSGTIPTQVGLLSNLVLINLSYQRVSGRLPTELGRASKLVEIRIQGTRISGTIPTELSGLEDLAHVHLDHNLITGEVPRFPSFPSPEDNVAMTQNTFECLIFSHNADETNCIWGCDHELRCCATTKLCQAPTKTTTTTESRTTTEARRTEKVTTRITKTHIHDQAPIVIHIDIGGDNELARRSYRVE